MSSGSSSEDEDHFESIIATRARRSNAGSRLRQLLDLEDAQNSFQTEDDENVNLLFQEEGEDEEFLDSDEEDGMEEEEEKEEQEEQSNVNVNIDSASMIHNRNEFENTVNQEKDESPANKDEMLSNSDISDSDTDESEGERELQHQEKIRQKRSRKSHIPHAIKKPKITTHSRPKKKNQLPAVQSSPSRRRYSARKSTVENTIATHEKLEKENERKQTVKIVPKKEYVERTLEERLEEAKITEAENKLSLTRFFEQEFEKKKKQRDLANSRKFKMAEYIRFYSIGKYVTALEEVTAAELEEKKKHEEAEKKAKRKKQYVRRKKNQQSMNTESEVQSEKDVIEKKELTNIIEKGSRNSLDKIQNSVEHEQIQQDIKPENKDKLQTNKPENTVFKVEPKPDLNLRVEKEDTTEESKSILPKDTEKEATTEELKSVSEDCEIRFITEEPKSILPNDTEVKVTVEEAKRILPNGTEIKVDEASGSVLPNDHGNRSAIVDESDNSQLLDSMNIDKCITHGGDNGLSNTNKALSYRPENVQSESINVDEVTESVEQTAGAQVESKNGNQCPATLEKTVRFSEGSDEVSEKDSKTDDIVCLENAIGVNGDEKPVYEGPPQFVTFNYVSFEEFHRPPGLREVKKFLFGPQSNLSGSLRDPHFKTMFTIKQDDSDSIDLQKIQEERNFSFQNLLRLPKFGEKYQIVEDLEDRKSKEEVKINITTRTPVGINLPNGNKKKCFINGEDASYYDPTNGIPYSSVECFKVLKRLAEGDYYWTQIDQGGINSRYKGGIGCYLGESQVKHAKGVPEGFE